MRQRSSGRLMNSAEGSMAVVCAIAMVALVGLTSLAIDLGHLYTVRNQLQNTVDSAGMAAARALIVEDTAHRDTYRDANAAFDAALNVIQSESANQGLSPVAVEARNDVKIAFGTYDDKTSTWALVGEQGDKSEVTSTSMANAVQVTLNRKAGTVYGPVTNFFAGILGFDSTELSASSTAYMGYTYSVALATIPIPLALPAAALGPTASNGRSGWFARLFGPEEAVAANTRTFIFKDTGGNNATPDLNNATPVDPNQAYWFTVSNKDQVPAAIQRMLDEAALTTHTHSNPPLGQNNRVPYFVDPISYGTQVWARSEYKYFSYLTDYFQRLKTAFDAKKESGRWRVTLPVFSGTQYPLGTSQRLIKAFRALAGLVAPWPSEAYACYVFNSPPFIYVNGFVNADITEVKVKSSCDQCSNWRNSTNPNTGKKYTSLKECMSVRTTSCWNANYAKFEIVTDVSTIIPGKPNLSGQPGGLENSQIPGSNAPTGVGAFAKVPKLVK